MFSREMIRKVFRGFFQKEFIKRDFQRAFSESEDLELPIQRVVLRLFILQPSSTPLFHIPLTKLSREVQIRTMEVYQFEAQA